MNNAFWNFCNAGRIEVFSPFQPYAMSDTSRWKQDSGGLYITHSDTELL